MSNFDVVEEEHPFQFRGKGYVLREPSESAKLKHQRKQFQNARMRDGKLEADVGDAVEAPSVLVGESVFEAGADKPVGQQVIREWPSKLVRQLYDKAREMMGADSAEDIDAQIAKLQELKEGLDPKKPSPGTATI